MDSFFTLVIIILFGLSIFVLARADGWSRPASWGVSVGVFAAPVVLIVVFYYLRMPAYVLQTLLGLAGVGAFVVLFALSKSVSNKLRLNGHALR